MSSRQKKLVSIVTPVLNEEGNISIYFERLCAVLSSVEDRYDFEFVFTDNCSEDRTFELLEQRSLQDDRVRVFRFSRNFGYQNSIYTGYCEARGDVAIQLDCDLEDPPELIPEFLEAWENGHDIVFGIRRSRETGIIDRAIRKAYYRLLSRLSEDSVPPDVGDFMLVDRKILNVLKESGDRNLYLRGKILTMGFRRRGIPYDRASRQRGESKFPLRRLLSLALTGIVSQSHTPLRVAMYTGITLSLLTAFGCIGAGVAHIFFDAPLPYGLTMLTTLMAFSISLNALFLGVIGEYLARIHTQVRREPRVIIERSINP